MAVYENTPKWQREILSFKGIKSTFMIEGNINDLYLSVDNDGEVHFENLNETLKQLLCDSDIDEGWDLMFCDPLFGFSDPLCQGAVSAFVKRYKDAAKLQREETEASGGGTGVVSDAMTHISEIIRAAITKPDPAEGQSKSLAVTINFASRLVSGPDHLSAAETNMFLNLLFASKYAIRAGGNIKTLILIVDKFNDVPTWFYMNNPNIRMITIPNPDRAVREVFIDHYFNGFNSADITLKNIRNKFIDMTEGMKLLELDELRRLFLKSEISIDEICDTVSVYKFGFRDNKWEAMRDRIEGDLPASMRKRVKGQEEALEKISRIIKRSVTGLSGIQHSSGGNKPRGIMFLAGPTGTGKTEIVKTVAEMLFGDEKALIRFDMSEYTAEHADQKLFGAPPGYVGYDQGGQLTNAVKTNPFSVLLFDEIEKAHPTIMDKFLQILEDGRMTDGQGNTVYFSETLIFFTSNAGISEEIRDAHGYVIGRKTIVQPSNSYNEIQESVEAALKTKFKPEVLNRIGKNIIVFNYITEAATGDILRSQIANICQELSRTKKVSISVDETAMQNLMEKCLENDIRENGGRGIGNLVEASFINPLAEYIFDSDIQAESTIIVSTACGKIVFERQG